MKRFLLMLTFLTRLPLPITFDFDEEDFGRGLIYLPVIGLLIGIPLWLFSEFVVIEHSLLKSFLLILIYIFMVGGLHLDGLADYMDGIFSGRKTARIQEIMQDSSIGVFGVAGICIYFLGLFIGFQLVPPKALLLMPFIGRTMAGSLIGLGKYPKEVGMGKALIDYGRPRHSMMFIVVMGTVLYFVGLPYLIAGSIVTLCMHIFLIRTNQLLGGVTGDVIGAAIELSQVLWLMALYMIGGF